MCFLAKLVISFFFTIAGGSERGSWKTVVGFLHQCINLLQIQIFYFKEAFLFNK